tara:strand:- start:245 stop:916 length:672 start_codon:yes stop_codon:yes gene_type:complete
MIEINKCNDYQELSNTVADIVEKQLNKKSDSRFILPTGSTPIGLYKELVNRDLNWSDVITYNLDEYLDNSIDEQSYYNFMTENLFKHINIKEDNICFPYDIVVWSNMNYGQDVDICLLGIGGNGHIAFNEPGSSFESETRVVDLTKQTIQDNSRFFSSIDDVPTKAITMGLKPIMSSKRIILMVNGKHKKDILHKALYGKITEGVPASILQTHTNLGVFYSDI